MKVQINVQLTGEQELEYYDILCSEFNRTRSEVRKILDDMLREEKIQNTKNNINSLLRELVGELTKEKSPVTPKDDNKQEYKYKNPYI